MSGKMVEKLQCLLIQKQATFGTAETDLATGDYIETVGPATMRLNNNGTEYDAVGSGFTQGGYIPGMRDLDLAFKVYCATNGSDAPGQYGTLLECSAFAMSESVDGAFVYTPTSNIATMSHFTAWLYSGNLETNGCFVRKAYNGIFSPKWTFGNGKPTLCDLSAKLGYYAIPAVGTQVAVTRQTTIPSAFLGASALSILGDNDYQVISGEIDAGQESVLTADPLDTFGCGMALVTDRKFKFNFKVYQDVPGTVDPETALHGKTTGALTITYGTVPQSMSWASTMAQFTDVEHNDEGGVSTWTISGIMQQNNFTHTLTTK